MLNLESLAFFEMAATELNFSKAARRAHLSAAAFGERIRGLEAALDAQLFLRTTRKVTLTTQGRLLLPQARRTLAEAVKCRDVVHHEQAVASKYELTLGTRFELGMSWLVPSLKQLSKSRPERSLHLYVGDSPDLFLRLARDEIDAMISSIRISSSKFATAPLHEEAYAFVATPKLFKRSPLRSVEDAEQHVLIDANRDLPLFSYFLDATPAHQLWVFKQTEHLGAIGAIRLRVLQHAGVAVLPLYFIGEDLRKGRLVQLMPKVKMQPDFFRLIWRKRQSKSNQLEQLAEELRAIPLR